MCDHSHRKHIQWESRRKQFLAFVNLSHLLLVKLLINRVAPKSLDSQLTVHCSSRSILCHSGSHRTSETQQSFWRWKYVSTPAFVLQIHMENSKPRGVGYVKTCAGWQNGTGWLIFKFQSGARHNVLTFPLLNFLNSAHLQRLQSLKEFALGETSHSFLSLPHSEFWWSPPELWVKDKASYQVAQNPLRPQLILLMLALLQVMPACLPTPSFILVLLAFEDSAKIAFSQVWLPWDLASSLPYGKIPPWTYAHWPISYHVLAHPVVISKCELILEVQIPGRQLVKRKPQSVLKERVKNVFTTFS